jgi:hypothetical protein
MGLQKRKRQHPVSGRDDASEREGAIVARAKAPFKGQRSQTAAAGFGLRFIVSIRR